jgi:endonuclease/exonuclease/phosphatase family metal-dependent hydrolase
MGYIIRALSLLALLASCNHGLNAGDRELTVATYNVRFFDDGYRGIRDTVKRLKPDIIAMQEVLVKDGVDYSKRLASELGYKHSASAPYAVFGDMKWVLSFLSRYPITAKSETPLGNGRKAFRITANINGIPVSLTTLHLSPFVWARGGLLKANLDRSKQRRAEIQKLLSWHGKPLSHSLILGDFNSVSIMGELSEIRDNGFNDIYRVLDANPKGTFTLRGDVLKAVRSYVPAFIIGDAVVFDYIFASEHVIPLNVNIDTSTASDHFPVIAKIKLSDRVPDQGK